MSVKKESKKKILKRLSKLKPRDLISVLWEDHYGEQGWQSEGYINSRPPFLCRSFGMYVGHNKRTVKLASTLDNNGTYNGVEHRLLDAIYLINEIKY